MNPSTQPELPHRIRRNKVLRVTAWIAVMLTITFLFLSRTRWYQIHHHRSVRNALNEHMWTVKPNTWKSYFTLEAFYWFMNRNTTLEERMARAGRHTEALLDLGYLESRQFDFSPPPGQGAMAALQPYMAHYELEPEAVLTFTGHRMGVTAPAKDMPKWASIIAAYNAAAITNSAPSSSSE